MRNLLLWMIVFTINLCESYAQSPAYILSVHDGDTYYAKHKNRTLILRLCNVDCPEVKNKYTKKDAQPFGDAARDSIKALILKKTVYIRIYGTDPYLRNLCTMTINGKSLQNIIIKKGWGWHFTGYQKGVAPDPKLLRYQNTAKKNKVGLWALPNPIPPSTYRHQ